MGEAYRQLVPSFNRSVRLEGRPEQLSSDAGAFALREAGERLGLFAWLGERLIDTRQSGKVTHSLEELVRTSLLLAAQGWTSQDDADHLRHDAAFRLAVSSRRGISPLVSPDGGRRVPDGLASQPTLSRMVRILSHEANRNTLAESLAVAAGRRIRSLRRGHRPHECTVDLDSLPNEVHGHQDGSEYNGHYGARVFHPLVATLGQYGDIVDVLLREGKAHTADGALDFLLSLLDRVEREVCRVADVRMDAGFPAEPLLAALEARGTRYVARVKNNAVLDRLAQPYLSLPERKVGEEPRTLLYDLRYRASSWSRERRVVLVLLERDGELFPHYFWLLTSWTEAEMPALALLEHYRQRGNAEATFGEWMSTLTPALSSARRPKSHYRDHDISEPIDDSWEPFAVNEAFLLLSALAYTLLHAVRGVIEKETGKGWSLRRVRDQVLKVAARVLVHGRRAIIVIAASALHPLRLLWRGFDRLSLPWNAT
jgi:hypothetical protein